jgi:hypothetical protein
MRHLQLKIIRASVAMRNSVRSTSASLVLLLQLPLSVHAGLIKEWQFQETATAPVLVTARVRGVHRNQRVPQGQLSWKAETWSMTADLEVLRAFTASGVPLQSHQIELHFLSYGPSVTQFVNGYPPPLPDLKSGEIRILSLKENPTPGPEAWRLMADSGMDITIAVRAEAEGEPAPPPPSARGFLVRELANTLSRGTPGEVAALSGYLSRKWEDLAGELMPLLDPAIGDNRQQWAEVAASLHAARGIPRPAIAELLSEKPEIGAQTCAPAGKSEASSGRPAETAAISCYRQPADPNLDCRRSPQRVGIGQLAHRIRRQPGYH